ncbi:folate-binding protein YgfZ [Pseudanabaena sp. FACHB-2040]|uniref:CAF17-like 4Fe-4S cluster assembly/insertion protein YgfZ n=1 Tax=Pseudanabaena sp. FACHB-2040 TaxID=2692859 RepID=UPI0016845348|nr:folate-binding protein YgfZ [Pseudanabaena sp. FACHB-2040]MBD2257170.1 folate-binding protein YgfZ [Pseudanabaena sp. FACHB-2040]
MLESLRAVQKKAGAQFDDQGIPLSFGQDGGALAAVEKGVAVCDRSHWGLLQVSDEDRLRFLHNQSTNDFQRLKPGEGCETVFVTSTARTIDLATAYATEAAVLLLTSPGQDERLMTWMDRYIFFADKVKLKNLTAETAIFSLVGPESGSLLTRLGEVALPEPLHSHTLTTLGQAEVRVAAGSGLASPGFTLLVAVEQAADLWQTLVEADAVAAGETVWNQLRVQQGRPVPGAELTEDYNPLEAGLWQTLSFEKGCYIGQETIARLNTYKGVKQQLWGLQLQGQASPGTPITLGDDKVGLLTSVVETATGTLGLGYIRTKAGGAGLTVRVGDTNATVIEVPFLSRGYLAAE